MSANTIRSHLINESIVACCHCRRRRGDAGDFVGFDFLEAIESGVQISHTICPDCIRLLYPDIADEILTKYRKNQNPDSSSTNE